MKKLSKNDIAEEQARVKIKEIKNNKRKSSVKKIIAILSMVLGLLLVFLGSELIKRATSERISEDVSYQASEGNCEIWTTDLKGGGKKLVCIIDEEYDICDPTEELEEIEEEKAKLTYSTGVIRGNINALEDGKDIVSFGGYDIGDAEKSSLQNAINMITEDGYEVAFLAIDLYTGKGVAYNPDQKIFGASTIKGPYVASLAKERDSIMENFGKEMEEAVTISNNFAYATLRAQYGSTYIREITDEMGISPEVATSDYPMMTAKELALLWDWNFRYFKNDLNSEKVETVKKWYENPEHSFIHGTLGEKYTSYTKPGWQSGAEAGSNVTNDAGIVMAGERPYIIVVLSTIPDDVSYMTELVTAIDLVHDELVGELTDEIVDED